MNPRLNARTRMIAERAYRYWEERGRPIGSPEIDWSRAAMELDDIPEIAIQPISMLSEF